MANQVIHRLLLLLCLVAGQSSSKCWAENLQTYTNPHLGIQLHFSDAWEKVQLEQVGLLLFLKNSANQYPSFNIIFNSDRYDLSRSVSEQKKVLIESYKLAGITKPDIITSTVKHFSFGKAFSAKLEYSINEQRYYSHVLLVPQNSHHLIITYIDKKNIEDYTMGGLLSKLTLTIKSNGTTKNPSNKNKNLIYWLASCLILALLLVYWWRHVRQTC